MKPTTKRIAVLLAALTSATVLLAACSVEAPPQDCTNNHSDYAAKYYLKEASGPECELAGELIHMEKYRPDEGRPQLGLLPEQIGPYVTDILAEYETDSPEDAICRVADPEPVTVNVPEMTRKLSAAELDAGYVDGGVFALPDGGQLTLRADGGVATDEAYTVSYDFANVRFYATPEVPSTQFQADLTYTVDNCTATYNVVAIYPPHHCETDEDCLPNRDLDAGRIFGSGINPAFDTFCDAETGYCHLKAENIGEESLRK